MLINKLFHQIWGEVGHTRSFIQNNLPLSIIKDFNFEKIIKIKGSFLEKTETSLFLDILYKIDFKKEGSAYIYILFEKRKKKDTISPILILELMTRIWKTQLNNDSKFFPIIPIILHHKAKDLNISLSTFKSFFSEVPNEIDRYIPNFQFKFCDLSSIHVRNFRYLKK